MYIRVFIPQNAINFYISIIFMFIMIILKNMNNNPIRILGKN